MKILLIIMTLAINFAQNIQYYEKNNIKFADVETDEYTFTCRIGGLENAKETIILLHGFPETSRMWQEFIKLLDDNGFRVIAPDQRGYSPGARPSQISDYSIEKLSKDIIDIADAFKLKSFHLIGHDWGSAVGWQVVANNPRRVLTWSALSVPHLDAFIKSIANNSEQQKKSEYIKFFKKPILPEIYFKICFYKNLKKIWNQSTSAEINSYLEIFKQKNALKSALNWYRANFNEAQDIIGEITTPTLIVYGLNDMAIGEDSVDNSIQFLKGKYKIEKLNAGHWLIQEAYNEFSEAILNFINDNN
ncbi:MAG: alpha/beta hydrolase [Candidatus Marinimicrobia bacterium]|nr:alpha/beta hydrolase [Candidatus Neomarinimicrobiota bacterium]